MRSQSPWYVAYAKLREVHTLLVAILIVALIAVVW